MIDDRVLEALVRDAGDTVEVPAGGRERVLAARDGFDEARLRRSARLAPVTTLPRTVVRGAHRRPFATAAVAASLLLVTIGCVGLASTTSGGPSAVEGTVAPHVEAPATSAAGPSENIQGAGKAPAALPASTGASAPGTSAPGTSAPGTSAPGLASPADVIKTGSVSLQIPDGQLTPVMNDLTRLASSLGGFVAATDTNVPGDGQPATGSVTLEVPSGFFETLLDDSRSIPGTTVTAVTTSGQDVTSQYVDVNARLQSLEDTRTQFEQVLARAQTIGDILAVEQQISDIESQIEQLQAQQRQMTNQIQYGTLTVNVSEQAHARAVVPPPPPPSGIDKAWDHARSTFTRGLDGVVGALGGIAVFLIVVGALLVMARAGWLVVRRRLV